MTQPSYGPQAPDGEPPPPTTRKTWFKLAARIGMLIGGFALLALIANVTNEDEPRSAALPSQPKATSSAPPRATYTPLTFAPLGPAREISAREWALIAKSPDSHVSERVVIYGYVTQFDAATGDAAFRANVDGVRHKQTYEYDTNAVIVGINAEQLAGVVQDDVFRAEVTILGSFSYTTTMGGTLTVPQALVDKIEVIGQR